jgi:hypothetical protein
MNILPPLLPPVAARFSFPRRNLFRKRTGTWLGQIQYLLQYYFFSILPVLLYQKGGTLASPARPIEACLYMALSGFLYQAGLKDAAYARLMQPAGKNIPPQQEPKARCCGGGRYCIVKQEEWRKAHKLSKYISYELIIA